MGPEAETLLIHRHEATGSINDRTTRPERGAGLGLQTTGTGFQRTGLNQLQPGHAPDQSGQPGAEDEKNNPEATGRHLGQRNDPGTGSLPSRR